MQWIARIIVLFSENFCRDVISNIDGRLTPANRYTVLTASNEETSIYIPCTPEENKWEIIQQRLDDSVSFEQNRTAYKEGFGSPDGNYFMGLNQIVELTNVSKKLQLYLESFDGDVAVLYYKSFKIGKTYIIFYENVHTVQDRFIISSTQDISLQNFLEIQMLSIKFL